MYLIRTHLFATKINMNLTANLILLFKELLLSLLFKCFIFMFKTLPTLQYGRQT